MKNLLSLLCGATLAFGLIGGCATAKPDFGDKVSSVSKDWNKGEALVKAGEARVKSGKADIKSGERAREKAGAAVARWTEILRADKAAYAGAINLTGTATTGGEVAAEAQSLRRLKKSIEKSEAELKDAKQARLKARKKVADGKARLSKGEAQVAEGKSRMKRAERDYRKVID